MRVKLYNVRLAFPQLFSPAAFKAGDDPRYSASFIVPPDHPNVKDLKKAMQEVAKEKWADRAAAIYKQLRAQDRLALHDGDLKSNYEGFEGNLYVSASGDPKRNQHPCVVGRDNRPLQAEDGRPYAGCYVNASVEIWAQDNQFGKRINATIATVQFVKDGERFGGGGVPASPDEFEPLDDPEADGDFAEDVDFLGGGDGGEEPESSEDDDDIPF